MCALISVLVPVFNVENYLRDCLDSIINQTYTNLEIICINDGSTDGSSAILKEYEIKDDRVRVVNKDNSGYGKSMNIALEMARGKYIAIVESDDYIEKDMMENLIVVAEEKNAELVRSNYYLYTKQNGDVFYEYFSNCTYNCIINPVNEPYLFFNGTWVWTSLYRADFLKNNNIKFNETPGASYQDIAFTLKVLTCAKRVMLLPEAYLHYRVDNMNASVQSKSKVYCAFDEFDELWRFLDERPQKRDLVAKFIAYFMIKNYHYQYHRIADDFKLGFVKRAVTSLLWLNERGYFQDEILREYQDIVHNVINAPNKFILSIKLSLQKRAMIREGFWQLIKNRPNVHLYGAGRVATGVADLLKSKKVLFKDVYVGVEADVGKDFYGRKTKAFSENVKLAADSWLLIAVGDDNGMNDIISKVDDLQSVIVMTSEIRDILTHE